MEDTEHLTDQQRKYVQHLAAGMPSRAAALAAGYSDSYARVAAHRLASKPAVVAALEEIRKKGCEMAAYGLGEAMRKAEAVCAFAKKHKNAMAYCKGTELRAKLSGLLIDRFEIVPVDLKGALEAARLRVINVTPLLFNGGVVQTTDPVLSGASRGPGTQGDPVGD